MHAKQLNSVAEIVAGPHLTSVSDDGTHLITEPLRPVHFRAEGSVEWFSRVAQYERIRKYRRGA